MRLARQVFWAPLCFGLFLTLPTPPVFAQDVLVPSTSKDSASKEKGDEGSSWFDMFNVLTPKSQPTKDTPTSNKGDKQSSTKNRQGKPSSKKDKAPDSTYINKDVEESEGKAAEQINDILTKLGTQTTQVIEQPENTEKDDRKFEHEVLITVDKLEFSDADLKKAAKGTDLKPEKILESCEPRFTGAITADNNAGESFDLRGGNGNAVSGYKGRMVSLTAVLALACKLDKPPVNKGIVPKFGDRYVFGIAQGGCLAPQGSLPSVIALVYTGSGPVTCKY